MKEQKRNSIIAFSFILLVGAILLFVAPKTFATVQDNTMGFSWAGNIGWVKANNCTDILNTATCGTGQYGVNILKTAPGTISGYMWSSNIGWIGFNSENVAGCPLGTCQAFVDFANKGASTIPVKGWARACSVFANGCSGALKGNEERGSWDGFIALSETVNPSDGWTSGGVTVSTDLKNMDGYAWGSDVVGWVDMSFAVGEPKKPECSDGVDNTDPEDTTADYPNDPGCTDPEDPTEDDWSKPPFIEDFRSQCISTPSEKPKLSWEAEDVTTGECRIKNANGTESPAGGISADKSLSSQLSGGVLATNQPYAGDGYYYKQSTLAAAGYSAVYTLECIGGGGDISIKTAVPGQCGVGGPDDTPQCRDGIDNDGDGKVDFSTATQTVPAPVDPGCTNADDNNEKDLKPEYEEQ